MFILTQFILRLSFGLALAMAVTPARWVTSGYFRNHLYVLLGMNVLAALAAASRPDELPLWPPLLAAVLSYVGSVFWLYEKPRPGSATLLLIAVVCLVGTYLALPVVTESAGVQRLLIWLDPATSGLLLGVTIAAMFLGHWYLNTPTMQLEPLRRLVVLMAVAIALRAIVSGAGLVLEVSSGGMPHTTQISFLALRWLSGLLGAAVLTWMTRETLEIPNTQSATGILYVAVIATFLGELTSLLLSQSSNFPL